MWSGGSTLMFMFGLLLFKLCDLKVKMLEKENVKTDRVSTKCNIYLHGTQVLVPNY